MDTAHLGELCLFQTHDDSHPNEIYTDGEKAIVNFVSRGDLEGARHAAERLYSAFDICDTIVPGGFSAYHRLLRQIQLVFMYNLPEEFQEDVRKRADLAAVLFDSNDAKTDIGAALRDAIIELDKTSPVMKASSNILILEYL